jgi:hypothetical protein
MRLMDSSFSLHGLFRRSSAHLLKCIVSIRFIQMADKLSHCALLSPQQMDVDDSDATEAPTVSTNSEATTLQVSNVVHVVCECAPAMFGVLYRSIL